MLSKEEDPADIYTSENISRTLKYYPVVGFIVAILLLLSVYVLQSFAQSHTLYVATVVVALWVFITGGLHLDGVADMADAWIGGLGDKEKTLTIMKDPVCGPFGVIAIVLTILLKLVFIYELLSVSAFLIFFAPLLARIWAVVLLMVTPYVRANGMGAELNSSEQKNKNIVSILIFFVLSLVGLNFLIPTSLMLILVMLCIVFFFLFRFKVVQRVGGVTGDIVGAFIEYMELMILFSLVTLLMI